MDTEKVATRICSTGCTPACTIPSVTGQAACRHQLSQLMLQPLLCLAAGSALKLATTPYVTELLKQLA